MVWFFILLLHALASLCSATPLESIPHLVPRADVPSQPPAVPPNEGDCHFQFFTQAIDHFGKHKGAFQQKYNLVTDFFEPGGPIFFYQGEEAVYLDCVDTSIAYSWAQQTHGIAVVLEHRYYGQSAPFGAKNPVTQHKEFEYLTLDNVMADGVNFLNYLKKNITGAADSKAIVLSGSYGGFLATVYRQNHPETIYGAIASAPPVQAITNNSNAEGYWNWNLWLNNVYQDRSAEASAKIKKAIKALEKRFNSGNPSSLKTELGLCSQPTKAYFEILNSWIHNVLSSAAEFNYPIVRPGRSGVALGLDKVVNIAVTQNDPIKLINEILWMYLSPLNIPCINLTDPTALFHVTPLIQQPLFNYAVCKYFPGYWPSDAPAGTIFHPTNLGAQAIATCDKEFNISTPSSHYLRTKYKYTDEDLRKSTRIIWSLGQYDPTSGVSPLQPGINAPVMSADRNVSRILYTSDMAHREDLFAPDPSDRDTVVQTRAIELETIKGWLGWYGL